MKHPTLDNTKPGDKVRHIKSRAEMPVKAIHHTPAGGLAIWVDIPRPCTTIGKLDTVFYADELEVLEPAVKLPATCGECFLLRSKQSTCACDQYVPSLGNKLFVNQKTYPWNEKLNPGTRPVWCPLYNGGLVIK